MNSIECPGMRRFIFSVPFLENLCQNTAKLAFSKVLCSQLIHVRINAFPDLKEKRKITYLTANTEILK